MSVAEAPMKREDYEKAVRKLQVELCVPRDWVEDRVLRVVGIFSDLRRTRRCRDTMKTVTERGSPRVVKGL
jgi:polyphosphate kinase